MVVARIRITVTSFVTSRSLRRPSRAYALRPPGNGTPEAVRRRKSFNECGTRRPAYFAELTRAKLNTSFSVHRKASAPTAAAARSRSITCIRRQITMMIAKAPLAYQVKSPTAQIGEERRRITNAAERKKFRIVAIGRHRNGQRWRAQDGT